MILQLPGWLLPDRNQGAAEQLLRCEVPGKPFHNPVINIITFQRLSLIRLPSPQAQLNRF